MIIIIIINNDYDNNDYDNNDYDNNNNGNQYSNERSYCNCAVVSSSLQSTHLL